SRWNYDTSYVGLPEHLEDIQLLLDQRFELEFEWRQTIPPPPQDMEAQNKIDLTDNTRWDSRTTLHSTTEEGDEDKNEDEDGGRGEDEDDEEEEPEPQLVQQNPSCNCHFLGYSTHSAQRRQ
ncbi:hypothetical protein Godav_028060, partial [Gossypium davidsonii]|nr:hypothetical protein [Gossypium davidsonii]MBA0654142.1 hypothetical protein [Gossypium klotzschianum]